MNLCKKIKLYDKNLFIIMSIFIITFFTQIQKNKHIKNNKHLIDIRTIFIQYLIYIYIYIIQMYQLYLI